MELSEALEKVRRAFLDGQYFFAGHFDDSEALMAWLDDDRDVAKAQDLLDQCTQEPYRTFETLLTGGRYLRPFVPGEPYGKPEYGFEVNPAEVAAVIAKAAQRAAKEVAA